MRYGRIAKAKAGLAEQVECLRNRARAGVELVKNEPEQDIPRETKRNVKTGALRSL